MIKKGFLKNNFIYIASAVIGGLLGYFFHFVVSRKLSVAQYGELQAITSLSLFYGVFSTALSFFIIKYSSVLAERNDGQGQVHFISFISKKFQKPIFGIFFIYVLLAPLLKKILHLSDYAGLVAIGASVVFVLFSAFYLNSLQGWKKFFALGAISVAAAGVKMLAGWWLSSAFQTASATSFSILISAIFGWILARSYSLWKWRSEKPAAEDGKWREKYFTGESFKKSFLLIFFFSLALAAAGNLDIILVKIFASPTIAGYYAALSVLGKIIMWLNLAVVGVLLPDAFSSGYFGRSVRAATVASSYGLMLLISLPSILVYYVFHGFLTELLFGRQYAGVSQYLWLFGLMAMALSFLFLEAKMAMARGDFRSTWILGAVVAVVASLIYFYHADLREIIWSVIISFLLGWIFIFSLNLANRYAGEPSQEKL